MVNSAVMERSEAVSGEAREASAAQVAAEALTVAVSQAARSEPVLAIENGTITITTQAGDVAIPIAADTTFQAPAAETQDDLELGGFVAIQGPEDTDGTITAESITILQAGGFGGGAGGFGGGGFGDGGGFGGGAGAFADSTVGVVDSIDGDTVTITTQTGSVVVTLTEATAFESPAFSGDDTSATRDSLEIGTAIAIQGPEDAGGGLLAESITVLPQAAGGRFPGAGGRTQNDYIDTVWAYDPEESVWTLLTSMPTPVAQAARQ